jgi:hypothetical protein
VDEVAHGFPTAFGNRGVEAATLERVPSQPKRVRRAGSQALPQRFVYDFPKRFPLPARLSLGAGQEVVGNVDRRFHMGNPIIVDGYPARRAQAGIELHLVLR